MDRLLSSLRILCLGLGLFAVTALKANVVDPETFAPHYAHEVFGPENGLPKAGFSSITQTPDGFLWIGTFGGLVRFDGAQFKTFDVISNPALGSSRISSLRVDADGGLWILTETGHLSRRGAGRIESCAPPGDRAQPVTCRSSEPGPSVFRWIDKGPTGSIWLMTSANELLRANEGRLTRIAELEKQLTFESGYWDRFGKLWLFTRESIWIYSQQALERFAHPFLGTPPYWPGSVAVAADGFLWLQSEAALGRVVSGPTGEPERLDPAIPLERVGPLAVPDPLGHLWITDSKRLLYYRDGETSLVARFEEPNIAVPFAGQIAVDAEGHTWIIWRNVLIRREGNLQFTLLTGEVDALQNIWIEDSGVIWIVSSRGSLHALYPSRAEVLSDGLSHPSLYTVFEEPDGGYRTHEARPALFNSETNRFEESPCPDGEFICPAKAYVTDGEGRRWTGPFIDPGGLQQVFPDGDFGELSQPESGPSGGIYTLEPARDGALWVGASRGFFRFEGGANPTWTKVSLRRPEEPIVRVVHETEDGSLWLGTQKSGLFHVSGDQIRHFDHRSEFPSDMIRSLWQDPDGYFWISTETAGLVRVDPRSIDAATGLEVAVVGADHGLELNAVHHLIADDFGDLWVSTNEGVFRGRYEDFRAAAEGNLSQIPLTHYTERDGMLDREVNGGNAYAGLKDRQGRILFPTQFGLARFDPGLEWPDEPLPKASVDSLRAGRQERAVGDGPIVLGPKERSFSIDYSAPFLRAPESLRFKVRLLPYDIEWIEVGARRTAFYTQVPPGDYEFQVTVAHQGLPHRGQWNPEAASIAVEVTPRFFETKTFIVLCVLLGLALLAAGVRWRIGHLRRQALRLEKMVDERTAKIREQAEQLRRLDRVKSDLFANVSHEFRTPLTLIIGSLQDARAGGKPQPAETRGYLKVALSNARRLLTLVDQLLDVAKVDSGGLALHLQSGHVDQLLRAAAERAVPLAERERVALEVVLPDKPILADFDERQLEKVFDNLVGNALKFVPEGGHVRVELTVGSDESSSYVVQVTDNGPGIAPEDLHRVFDRFHQAGHESRHPGSGLGLTLAKQIIELHGGTLTVESTVGEGTTFSACLPRANGQGVDATEPPALPEEKAAPKVKRSVSSAAGVSPRPKSIAPAPRSEKTGRAEQEPEDRATILIVDDNGELRAYLRRHLETTYRVLEAVDGRQALDLARRHRPDVIVSDIMMPRLDGRELFRLLRADPELELIPVILVTAMASKDSRLDGLRQGVDDYLVKPFDPQELIARIGNLLSSRKRLLDRLEPPASRPAISSIQSTPTDQTFLEKVQRVIEDRLDDTELTVEILAKEVGCDRSHLFRRLRALVDQSPSELIRTMRLQRAEQLLQSNAGRVNEIAYSVGFKSLSHFSNTFAKVYGERPSAFAARHREG